jgi:hypothetical protein
MAKENINLDQFFKEKLSQDNIKPSKLAWERLESQLPQKKKSKAPVIWWSVAASVVALFVAGYFAFTLSSDPTVEPILASTENQIEEVIGQAKETPSGTIQEIQTQPEEKITTQNKNTTKPTNSTTQKPASNKVNSPASNLIAVADEKPEAKNPDRKIEITPVVEEINLPTLELPNLKVNQTVAKAEPAKVEAPAYRVKIYSDGLEEDKTLIRGISKKVEQVEGLLGKVDQGFADLQDAKNNLFTALLTKKEKAAEKP